VLVESVERFELFIVAGKALTTTPNAMDLDFLNIVSVRWKRLSEPEAMAPEKNSCDEKAMDRTN